MKRCYDVNGLRLIVEAQSADLLQSVVQPITLFAMEVFDDADYQITICRGPSDAPADDAESLFRGDIVPDVPSQVAVKDDRTWIIAKDQFSVLTNDADRATHILISDGCELPLQAMAGIHAIDAALAASGQFIVHSAALVPPSDASGAVLILAPSGTGKTTTSLALVLGGFGLIADDAIVLQPRGYRGNALSRIWGFQRPIKVHRRTAELLPAIAPLLGADWDREGEQPLQMATLAKSAHVLPPHPVTVRAIALLRQKPSLPREHRMVRLEKSVALLEIAQDNIRSSKRGVLSVHAKRFAALGDLIATTPTFELKVGGSLASLPELVVSALEAVGDQRREEQTDG